MINSASGSFLAHPTNDLHRVLHNSLGLFGTAEIMFVKDVKVACMHCTQGSFDLKMRRLERPVSSFSWVFSQKFLF